MKKINNKIKWLYCSQCAVEKIIQVDNANEYVCNNCIRSQMQNERIKTKNKKLEQANYLIQEIDISKYTQKEYRQIVNLIFQEIFYAKKSNDRRL
jgi:hypothetical protein